MANDHQTIIEPGPRHGGLDEAWLPVEGPETLDFLDAVVPQGSRESMRDSAVAILSKCVPPTALAGQETGLIVGYVQSGKTMSFESVIALARDNGFPIVIILAGTSIPLLEQSSGRLRRDLRLDEPERERRWIQLQNPSTDDATIHAIRDVLADWADPGTPESFKRTILITVLKHHRRLQNLTDLITTVDAQSVPVLIVDDEADQASLNTEVAQGQESTTYRCLMDLRDALPKHSYLQYTATPQAPLLLSIIDSLSPNFVQVLEVGEEYVGGRDFFGQDHSYLRLIPAEDVPVGTNPLSEPPESLLDALRVFMIGVTAGMLKDANRGNRSMMVHPSHLTGQHQEFYNWVRDIFDEWKRILSLPEEDPDRQELIEDFREAYDDLAQTVGSAMPAFESLTSTFPLAFRNTRVLEVNARGGRTPAVDWRSSYGWILVGGQAMDRGFTVEGLTVTYMPRGIGVGNADTVQQRARFFGYKRAYLGYCRVYLEQGTQSAFRQYVDHEEDIRAQLQRLQEGGQTLNEWKRAFVLAPDFRPCRQNVLEFDYIRGQFSDAWVAPRVLLAADPVLEANRAAVAAFVRDLNFAAAVGHPDRTPTQSHDVCKNIALREVVERLLVRIRITGTTDSQRNTGLLLQLSRALDENPEEVCSVFRMSPTERRRRGVDENGEVTNLFQGEAPVHPREHRGEIYPGDRAVVDPGNVTIQIHQLDLTNELKVVKEDVVVVAVWVPSRLARPWLAQAQPLLNR